MRQRVEIEKQLLKTLTVSVEGPVTVSHTYCLEMVPMAIAAATATADYLAKDGIAIMTTAPGHLAFPPINLLRQAGVTVFSGSDDVRNAWYPFSQADRLERAALTAYQSDFRTDTDLSTAFDLVTTAGAAVLGQAYYGLRVGPWLILSWLQPILFQRQFSPIPHENGSLNMDTLLPRTATY